MANLYEIPAALDRDMRGTVQEKKRQRDQIAKWSNSMIVKGTQYGANCNTEWGLEQLVARNEEAGIKTHWKPLKPIDTRQWRPAVGNMAKPTRASNQHTHMSRVRTHLSVQEELRNTTAIPVDLLPIQRTGHGTVFDGVSNTPIYGDGTSEGAAGPPPQRLTLDVFIKESARGTEKLVEKEYEVLDANGEKVRGRKVRQVLRNAKNKGDDKEAKGEMSAVEDDGFELV